MPGTKYAEIAQMFWEDWIHAISMYQLSTMISVNKTSRSFTLITFSIQWSEGNSFQTIA